MERTVQEWAIEYRQRGFAICRLLPGGKDLKAKGWSTKSAEPGDLLDQDNLGILTGVLSGNLVCIDLDATDAVAKADEFLPPTNMIEGRPSKPRSHRYFVVRDIPPEHVSRTCAVKGGPKTTRFNGPAGCIVELRGTGAQAVAPPSLHSSGERRQWDTFGEPAVVDFTVLWDACCRLAVACGWQEKTKAKKAKATKQPVPEPAAQPPTEGPNYLPGVVDIPMSQRAERFQRYAEKVAPAVAGQGGHDATFRFCRLALVDFALDSASAWPVLVEWNQRCQPPWDESELRRKLDQADAATEPRGGKLLEVLRSPTDPDRLAEGFLGQSPPIKFWRGGWYLWGAGYWRQCDPLEVCGQVWRFVEVEFTAAWRQGDCKKPKLAVGEKLVNNVLAALRSRVLLPSETEPGTWLPDGSKPPWLAVANGLLDLNSRELRDHSPDFWNLSALPYPFEAGAKCPMFLDSLAYIFTDDAAKADLLQETAGYLLCDDNALQRFFIFTGSGANGKSSIAAALEALIGSENVSHLGFSDLAQRFALNGLIGKRLNVGSEWAEGNRLAEDVLKRIASGDGCFLDRKNAELLVNVRLPVKLLFLCNELPRFTDKSDGLWRRLVILPFSVTIPEAERRPGMDRVDFWSTEAPGLLNWALDGRDRLLARGRFEPPISCREAVAKHRQDCDPVALFVAECVSYHDDAWTSKADAYNRFKQWADVNRQGARMGQVEFGKRFLRVTHCQEGRPGSRGCRTTAYLGLNVRVEAPVS
jgi:P4 family phage/plasmid primase-like protien